MVLQLGDYHTLLRKVKKQRSRLDSLGANRDLADVSKTKLDILSRGGNLYYSDTDSIVTTSLPRGMLDILSRGGDAPKEH